MSNGHFAGGFARGVQPGLSNLAQSFANTKNLAEAKRQFDINTKFKQTGRQEQIRQFNAQQRQINIQNQVTLAQEEFRLSKESNQSDIEALNHYNRGLRGLHEARKAGGRTNLSEFKPVELSDFRPGRKLRAKMAGEASQIINNADLSSLSGLVQLEKSLLSKGADLNQQLGDKGIAIPKTGIFSPVAQINRLNTIGDILTKQATLNQPIKVGATQRLFDPNTKKVILDTALDQTGINDTGTWISAGTTKEGTPILRNNKSGNFKVADISGIGAVYPALQNPSSQVSKDLAQLSQVRQSMSNVLTNLTDDTAVTKFRDKVGIIAGTYGKLADKFVGVEPETAKSYAELATAFTMVYALSGKQVSDKEINKFKPFLPNANLPAATLEVRLNVLIDYLNNLETTIKTSSKASGRPFRNLAPEDSLTELPNKFKGILDTLPEGAVKVGTSGGKPVYRTPNGKMFIGD
jgi:hypothetical protein